MFDTVGIVDTETTAKRIQTVLRAGKSLACNEQCINGTRLFDCRVADHFQFMVDEAHIERCIVNDQRGLADESHEIIDDFDKPRLVAQKCGRQSMHLEGFFRHIAFGIDIDVKMFAGRHLIDDFQTADFDQPIAALWRQACRFGIENYLAYNISSVG